MMFIKNKKILLLIFLIVVSLVGYLAFRGYETRDTKVQSGTQEIKTESDDGQVSANDILKDVDNPAECGQTCQDDTCQEIRDCLYVNSDLCLNSKGRVVYEIPNSENKKAIEYVIAGKEGDRCVYKGVKIGTKTSLDTPSPHSFTCILPGEYFKQIFMDMKPEKFIMENCSGTYVDFLKTKINPSDSSSAE